MERMTLALPSIQERDGSLGKQCYWKQSVASTLPTAPFRMHILVPPTLSRHSHHSLIYALPRQDADKDDASSRLIHCL